MAENRFLNQALMHTVQIILLVARFRTQPQSFTEAAPHTRPHARSWRQNTTHDPSQGPTHNRKTAQISIKASEPRRATCAHEKNCEIHGFLRPVFSRQSREPLVWFVRCSGHPIFTLMSVAPRHRGAPARHAL